MRLSLRWQLLLGLFAYAGAQAQDTSSAVLVAEARVKLRRDPSTKHAAIGTIAKKDTIQLVADSAFVSDFYHVVTQGGDTGWAAFPYLRPADTPAISASDAASALTQLVDLTNPASSILTTWEKPRPIGETFVTSTGRRCKAEGADGGDWRTNFRKNRADAPSSSHAVIWDALADTSALPFARGGLSRNRKDWTAEEAADVARYEGIPITVTGFIVVIKPQSSNTEDTNCSFTGEANTDWHVAFHGSPNGIERTSVVIEPTPRWKKRHPNWRRPNLRSYEADRRADGDSVRITGFLFYDPSHANHLKTLRISMWEIHPITRIEIFRTGVWVNIDD